MPIPSLFGSIRSLSALQRREKVYSAIILNCRVKRSYLLRKPYLVVAQPSTRTRLRPFMNWMMCYICWRKLLCSSRDHELRSSQQGYFKDLLSPKMGISTLHPMHQGLQIRGNRWYFSDVIEKYFTGTAAVGWWNWPPEAVSKRSVGFTRSIWIQVRTSLQTPTLDEV